MLLLLICRFLVNLPYFLYFFTSAGVIAGVAELKSFGSFKIDLSLLLSSGSSLTEFAYVRFVGIRILSFSSSDAT